MGGASRGAKLAFDAKFVSELEMKFALALKGGFNVHKFAVMSGIAVSDGQFQDGAGVTLGFDFDVGGTQCLKKIQSSLFKPDWVNGVMNDSHLVGF